jgi:hypothetical protein
VLSPGCAAISGFGGLRSVLDTTFFAGEVFTLSFAASGDENVWDVSIANSAGELNEPLLSGRGPEGEALLVEVYTFDGSETGVYVDVTPWADMSCSAAPTQSTTTTTTAPTQSTTNTTVSGAPATTVANSLPESGRTWYPTLILASAMLLSGAGLTALARRST